MRRRDLIKNSLFGMFGLGTLAKLTKGKGIDKQEDIDKKLIETTWEEGKKGQLNFLLVSGCEDTLAGETGKVNRLFGLKYSHKIEGGRNVVDKRNYLRLAPSWETHCIRVDKCNVKEGWIEYKSYALKGKLGRRYLRDMCVIVFDEDWKDVAIIRKHYGNATQVYWKK